MFVIRDQKRRRKVNASLINDFQVGDIFLILFLAPEPPRIQSSDQKITQLKKHEILEAKIGDQLTLLAGVKVIITCLASGLPTPTVQWRKDGEDLSVSGNRLEIKNATTQDTGVFTCEAVNRAGRFSHSSELRVIGKEGFFHKIRFQKSRMAKNLPRNLLRLFRNRNTRNRRYFWSFWLYSVFEKKRTEGLFISRLPGRILSWVHMRDFSPVTEIPVGKTEISTIEPARPLI